MCSVGGLFVHQGNKTAQLPSIALNEALRRAAERTRDALWQAIGQGCPASKARRELSAMVVSQLCTMPNLPC
jgi:hypothetical protein